MLEGREWRKAQGACHEAIANLRSIAPAGLPQTYYALLALTNGGEGPLPVQPLWFCLGSAQFVAGEEKNGTFHEFFEGLFVIGSNGGGEAVAFDTRKGLPYPIVAFGMTNADLSESVRTIATSFDEFVDLIGQDTK